MNCVSTVMAAALSLGTIAPAIVNADCRPQLARTTSADEFEIALVSEGNEVVGATVLHKNTGLMWMRCEVGQGFDQDDNACTGTRWEGSWQQAFQLTADINAGTAAESNLSYDDWRVPNFKELNSVIDYGCFAPALDPLIFNRGPIQEVWSATPDLESPEAAQALRLSVAQQLTINKSLADTNFSPGLWLVRDAE